MPLDRVLHSLAHHGLSEVGADDLLAEFFLLQQLEHLERQKVIRELNEQCQTPERNDARSDRETLREYRVTARSR